MNKTITLNSEGQFAAISDEAIDQVLTGLNHELDGDSHIYSRAQVKAAMWSWLEDEITDLQDEFAERFMAALDKMSTRKETALLGEPQEPVAQVQAEAHADYLYELRQEG